MIISLLLSLAITGSAAERPTDASSLNQLLDKGSQTIESTRLRTQSRGPRLPFYSLKWPTPKLEEVLYEDIPGKGKGLLLAAKRASDVLAPASGVVKYVGSLGKHDSVVILDHQQRTQTIFIGLDKKSVKVGQNVYSGQKFAKLPAYGSQIHEYFFELRYKGKAIDPLPYMNRRG